MCPSPLPLPQGVERLLDSGVESVKKCLKQVAAFEAGFGSSTSTMSPRGDWAWMVVAPTSVTCGDHGEPGEGHILRVSGCNTQMAQEMVRRGLMVQKSSGKVDVRLVEPFDEVKVAVGAR